MVAVPRREVQSRAEPLGSTGVHELANDVALPAAERARGDRVSRRGSRPETEAVVMLRREDQRAEAGGLRRACPLSRVEPSRIEDGRVFLAVPPFTVGEGVHPEMEEHRQLVALPGQLRLARHRECGTAARRTQGERGTCSGGQAARTPAAPSDSAPVWKKVRRSIPEDSPQRVGRQGHAVETSRRTASQRFS